MPAIAAALVYYYAQIAVSADSPSAIVPALVISCFILILGAIMRIATAYLMRWLQLDRPFPPQVNTDILKVLDAVNQHQNEILNLLGQFLQGVMANVKPNPTETQTKVEVPTQNQSEPITTEVKE